MVEKIEELRKLCEKEKPKKPSPIRKMYHEISLYFVKGLLHTPLNANQISSLGIIFGGLSSIFFAYATNLSLISGVLFLNFWIIMDYCDGKVARYRGTVGVIGGILDWLNIRIVPHMLFPSIGIGISIRTECFYPLLIGLLTSFLWFITHTLHGVRRYTYGEVKKTKSKLLKVIGKALKVDLTKGKRSKKGILFKLGDSGFISVGITIFAMFDIIIGTINNSLEGMGLLIILTYFFVIYIMTLVAKGLYPDSDIFTE